jgi:ankyrin repeat protein
VKELIHCLDHEGKNVFSRAVEIKDEEMCHKSLEYLVKMGGDIRHKDINKQTILYFASRYEKEEIVRYLLTFNFSLNDDDYFSQTPLFYSAKFNRHARITEALLRAGCDVNHKDGNGQTCLFYAAGAGNIEVCRLFVEFGANVQIYDKNREKASNYARKNGHQKVVDYLNNCKNEIRRVKEEHSRRVQDSSQNTVEPRKKK